MNKLVPMLLLGLFAVCLIINYASFNIPVSKYVLHENSVDLNIKQKEEELFKFVQKHLLGPEGEVYTRPEGDGADKIVLSESIGLFMQYCVLSNRQELFDKELEYMEKRMLNENSLLKWRTGEKESSCNALVDDFRVIEALSVAYEKWEQKKYLNRADLMQNALLKKLTGNNELYELYDWKSDRVKKTIPLCYLNLYAMDGLRIFNKKWLALEARGEMLLKNGMLNSPIPCYYKYFSYEKSEYLFDEEYKKQGGINLTYTLIVQDNLAKMNYFSQNFMDWLGYESKNGTLYAWYNPYNLKPSSDIESTAVYALAAIYADRAGEKELSGRLLNEMMKFRIEDSSSPFYGGFGYPGEFYSFDNLTALLAMASSSR